MKIEIEKKGEKNRDKYRLERDKYKSRKWVIKRRTRGQKSTF